MSIIDISRKWLESPYVFGGNGTKPGEEVDCSRLIQQIMNELGIDISRTTKTQHKEGKQIHINNMIPGDCIYFDYGKGIQHVGLYIGNNKMIHASSTKRKVVEEDIGSHNHIKTIRRFLPQTQLLLQPKHQSGILLLNSRIPLKYIDKSSKFLLGDYNGNKIMDLFCFKNGDNRTEIHILNGADNFQTFLLQMGTALHNYNNEFEFKLGNCEEVKPNIYCIKKNKTSSKSTEIHILNGDKNYQSFLYQSKSALYETDDNWNFEVGEYNNNEKYNIYCIHKNNTDSKYTEIQILNGSYDYQSFLEPKVIKTSLHETDNNWEFLLRDYNHDGNLDLYCINKNGENNSTEVIILSGKSKFKECILKVNLCLYYCDDNFQFCAGVYGGYECIFGLKKNEILEIHICTI